MIILFDIGATKTRIARAKDDSSFDDPIIYATPANYKEGIELLRENITKLLQDNTADRIIGCIAGPWDETSGTITDSGNLPDWHNKPLRDDLSITFGAKALIDNDAVMAGLGESIFGAGRGEGRILYITVSTGVGGAIISNGKIEERLEPRKEVVNEKSETLGDLISGKSVENRTGKKPKEITDPEFWDSLAIILAKGLNSLIKKWSPEVVIIGGSMMSEIGISLENTEKYLKKLNSNTPQLKHAELGDLGGLYGALAYNKNLEK
jgi:predicted NBD/HSP70 family sugar kinase